MNTTGSLFSQTLQDITNIKLEEIAKRRKAFEDERQQLLKRVQREQDAVTKLTIIADGVRSCFDVAVSEGRVVSQSTNNPRLEVDLNNLNRFLQQVRYDPSISLKVLGQWKQSFLRHLDIQSLKFSFASLYGQLTTEWLQSKQSVESQGETENDDFERISTAKKLHSRMQWEQTVFQPASVDEAAIEKLLQDTFDTSSDDSKQLKEALETLRQRTGRFEESMASWTNFTTESLSWAIKGLVASDLLTEDKRAVLKDFASNQVIVNEIADVLNMRLAALDTWSWGDEVPLEERRRVNGTYDIYMHEDLLQAIFLQFIGVTWSVFWKDVFTDLRRSSGIWKSPRTSVAPIDQKRRNHYLGQSLSLRNVQSIREKLYRKTYFVSRLMDSETQESINKDGDEEAEIERSDNRAASIGHFPRVIRKAPRRRLASHAARKVSNDNTTDISHKKPTVTPNEEDEDEDHLDIDEPKNPMRAKQSLLHLLSTEIMIKTRLHGEISCFRSQLDNFYPSLPHVAITSVLKFFGVGDKWLSFFERYLQAPLRFIGDSSAPRLRERGTPGSHVLSEVFGEVVLFCLDLKINQVTDGEMLWRLHDDIWFWSSDYGRCVKAWTAVSSFAKIMGLCLNEARTGSARMLQKTENGVRSMLAVPVESPLPKGQIRWGMLYLNPDTGRFEIDGDMVENHIHELSRQLQDKSVFAWIQAWNTYAITFFTSNFGQPANCFGRQHVDSMLATHARIQREIFSSSTNSLSTESGSVVSFLRHSIEQRFGYKDIPDGYFFFPIELGGLEVRSPFIGLLQIQEAVLEHPEKLLDTFEEAEKEAYKAAKTAYNEGSTLRDDTNASLRYAPEDPDTFMPYEEYTKYREILGYGFDDELVHVFNKMLERPDEGSIDIDNDNSVKIALNSLRAQSNISGFYDMEPYWKWVAQLYGPEVIDRFGGLRIVDPGLLPIGMVKLFRSARVKWQD